LEAVILEDPMAPHKMDLEGLLTTLEEGTASRNTPSHKDKASKNSEMQTCLVQGTVRNREVEVTLMKISTSLESLLKLKMSTQTMISQKLDRVCNY